MVSPNAPRDRWAAAITKVGRLLYGTNWQTPLAEKLGKGVRTVRHWAKGDSLPPHSTAKDLQTLLRDQAKELGRAAEELNEWIDHD